MAVLEKIRVKFGILITVLVAVALLSFIVDPQTLQSAAQMFSNENKVGEMNGKTIGYKDFYEKIDYYTNLSEMLGQKASDEQAQASIREVAWEAMFDEYVFAPAMKKAGIYVGDQEMLDLAQGDHISPILMQQAIFAGETGQFSPAAVKNFVASIDQDPSGQSAIYWNFLEKSMYKERIFEKYTTLLKDLSLQSNLEKDNLIANNNVTFDVDYVMVPVNFGDDSTISVSGKEIQKYYNDHKKNFKQTANRDIEYVMFEVEPSQEDIDAARAEYNELYAQFKASDNMKNFVAINSDAKWDAMYYTKEELAETPEFASAFSSKVSDIHVGENSFEAISIVDKAKRSDNITVSYVAFPINDDKSADSLLNVVKKSGITAEFAELGTLTQEQAVANGLTDLLPLFKEGVKVEKIRSIGIQANLICCVTSRSAAKEKYQVARFVKNVLPSEDTYRDYLIKATNVADKAKGKLASFNEVVTAENLPVIPANNITEATRRIGVCDNARELVRWVFDKKTKKGDVSEVIIIDNKYYFVAAVTETRKEGYSDIKEEAARIKNVLTMEKKVEKLQAEVAEKIAGKTDINDIAATLDATVSHRTGVSFGSQYQQYDNAFLGALINSQKGALVGPVKSDMGVVVFTVAERTEGAFYTAEDAETYNAQKNNFNAQMFVPVMNEYANVKDNRARFF